MQNAACLCHFHHLSVLYTTNYIYTVTVSFGSFEVLIRKILSPMKRSTKQLKKFSSSTGLETICYIRVTHLDTTTPHTSHSSHPVETKRKPDSPMGTRPCHCCWTNGNSQIFRVRGLEIPLCSLILKFLSNSVCQPITCYK